MPYPVPILFIIFNRPQIARQAFDRIRHIQPSTIYIASDGPRTDQEKAIVQQTREEILHMITWPCHIQTLFRETNLGCSIAVYSAINWFFSQEEYGIILEDDCIAEISFFDYMQELLLRYKDNHHIGMIAGYNPVGKIFSPDSYCFSKYKACWGWGSWQRAWNSCMDINMRWRGSNQINDILYNMGDHGKDIKTWQYKIRLIDKNYVSAWDWQWYFSLAANDMLTIFPSVNLISNIGNDKNATHTSFGNITKLSYAISMPLKHPQYILPSQQFDQYFYKQSHSFRSIISRILPLKLKQTLKTIYIRIWHK